MECGNFIFENSDMEMINREKNIKMNDKLLQLCVLFFLQYWSISLVLYLENICCFGFNCIKKLFAIKKCVSILAFILKV